MQTKISIILFLLFSLLLTLPAQARNVDLSTVPVRQTVQLTIYNSEDITLVRETRAVTFKKGNNPLQFSWANTKIDPTSVELKFLTHPDKLDVLDTTFPHDKPQMLYWNVQSDFDGEATIEITYFTSGITWSADYVGIADKDEKLMQLDGFVRITNHSGEDYENAQVRLVVGTINLVEKIAQLANVSMDDVGRMELSAAKGLRQKAARRMMERNMPMPVTAPMAAGMAFDAMVEEKEIIKEGLSEYFIFTIPGAETVREGWSKRMRAIQGKQVPLLVEYRYRLEQYGDQLVRMYLMTNDKASKLGDTPLPDGMVRLFRQNGREGLSYLTQQPIKYIPIGDKIELNLGPDRNVIFEWITLKTFRDEMWMQLHGASVYRKVGEPGVAVEVNSSVAGWNEHQIFTQRIRNYSGRPIAVEIRRAFDGHVLVRSGLAMKLHDYRTVEFRESIEAGQKKEMLSEVVTRQGYNARQNNVSLEKGEVAW